MNNIYIKVEYILEVNLAYNNAGLEHEMLKYHGHQYPSVQHYNLLEKVASQVIALLEIQHYNILEKVASQVITLLEILHSHSVVSMHLGVLEEVGPHLRLPYLQLYVFGRQP